MSMRSPGGHGEGWQVKKVETQNKTSLEVIPGIAEGGTWQAPEERTQRWI